MVVTIDNPPVNAISPSVRAGLDAAIGVAEAAEVSALVLLGAHGTFMAGADVRQLGRPMPARSTAAIINRLEALDKPVIAALQGHVLGGGLEFALGCHYRIAVPGTRLGTPEVDLGLIPGAGATQRLPRLVGVVAALELLVFGKPVGASQAHALGLVDRLVEAGDLRTAALLYAEELLAAGAGPQRTGAARVECPADLDALLRAAADRAAQQRVGEPAPQAAINAVRAAVELPLAQGLEVEAQLFAECRASPEAAAFQHLFRAERRAMKPDVLAQVQSLPLPAQVGVVGAGTMGRGIALALADAGFAVCVVEPSQAARERATIALDEAYARAAAKGKVTAAQAHERRSRIDLVADLAALADAGLVIEAVFEDLALKQAVFSQLDALCRQDAVFATNTSALDIDQIALSTARPSQVLGLHFFSPAQVMRLVEIIRGRDTSPPVLAMAFALARRLRKIGVLAGNCDGFIGNRMLMGYRREAEALLLEGASPRQIDEALRHFGMAMGPHEMADMAGLDVAAAGRRRRRAAGLLPDDPRLGAVADRLVEQGHYGQKTRRGFYDYTVDARTPMDCAETLALIEAEAARLGIERRHIDPQEIVLRCILPLVNEGARLLEAGLAQSAADIDVVWTTGYGFPRRRGGPMHYAETLGLERALAYIDQFARQQGPTYWTVAPLLRLFVAEGRSLRSEQWIHR